MEGSGAPSEFRASQMNLILHFGLPTTPEDACARFEEAIHFSQRYPCRIIVLCPEEKKVGERFLEAKLFAQCYIGHTPRSMCCCEALMLGYPPGEKSDLANQISIWLESDLPTCQWFHRVPVDRIKEHYLTFSRGLKRILFDRTVEGATLYDIDWDRPDRVKDLASARLLPLRQSIGQYLSGYQPEKLIQGVTGIRCTYSPALSGEAKNLSAWMSGCLKSAGAESLTENFEIDDTQPSQITGEWVSDDAEHQFSFELDFDSSRGCLHAKFGGGTVEDWPFEAHLLGSREALSEAVFF